MEKIIILGVIVTYAQKDELQVLIMHGVLVKCHLCCSFKSTENVMSRMGKDEVKACKQVELENIASCSMKIHNSGITTREVIA